MYWEKDTYLLSHYVVPYTFVGGNLNSWLVKYADYSVYVLRNV